MHRTAQPLPSIEQEAALSTETKSDSVVRNRRPPPPPPLSPIDRTKSNKTRLSRKCSTSNSNIGMQQRTSSALSPRTLPTTAGTTKRAPLKEEHLLKRSSSADRVGRERWLHHITDSLTINNRSFS